MNPAFERLARVAEEGGFAPRSPAMPSEAARMPSEAARMPSEAATMPSEAARMVEAILFASAEPLGRDELARRLPAAADLDAALSELRLLYGPRGVNLVEVGGRWAFRTAGDLAHLMSREVAPPQKLSRAALEVLAIIAYHQPATRAEIEEIRGVTASKGTLDTLLETGWIRLRGRRRVPGRPVTYGTTPGFLSHFGLGGIADLPGLDELKALSFLDGRMPPGFDVPLPRDDAALAEDEEPLGSEVPELDPDGR